MMTIPSIELLSQGLKEKRRSAAAKYGTRRPPFGSQGNHFGFWERLSPPSCRFGLPRATSKLPRIRHTSHIYDIIYIYMLPPPTFSYLYRKIPTKDRLSWAGGEATNTFQLSGPDFANFQLSNLLDVTFQLPGFPTFHLPNFPAFHWPTFQHSNFPTFQLSNFPTFQHSNFPISQLPNFPTFQLPNFPTFQLSNFFGPDFGMLESWKVRPTKIGKLECWKVRPNKVGKLESEAQKHWTKAGKSAHKT